MEWWDNLWLNESFAEFICHQAFDEIYRKLSFTTVIPYVSFCVNKQRGYDQDQLPSTHPIKGAVPDTDAANSIFDGITYQKGSSVLRQLMAILGEDIFSKACSNYFKKYQFSNTRLEHLIAEFQAELDAAGSTAIDLKDWQKDWINAAGVNQLLFVANPEDRTSGTLIQTAALSAHPTIRNHQINIGFFDAEGKLLESRPYRTSKTGSDVLTGLPEGWAAVLPNDLVVDFSHEGSQFRQGAFGHRIYRSLQRQVLQHQRASEPLCDRSSIQRHGEGQEVRLFILHQFGIAHFQRRKRRSICFMAEEHLQLHLRHGECLPGEVGRRRRRNSGEGGTFQPLLPKSG